MKEEKESTAIIGGADAPTCLVLTPRAERPSRKGRIRQSIYQWKYRRAEKRISANAHTLEEVAAYAGIRYRAAETPGTQRKYLEQKRAFKEGLRALGKEAGGGDEGVPGRDIPLDFHLYEIKTAGGHMEIEIDFFWKRMSISYVSGRKKAGKRLKKIAQDLYAYYGVSEEDVQSRSERYAALAAILSL
ncbi:MAG TPA: hypothetical protein H9674_02200 [Firmicutes bacterium]|nr:hypothetical protein [Bacillota bacterium]